MPNMPPTISLLLASVAVVTARSAAAQAERPICTVRELRTGRIIRVADTSRVSVVGPFVSCSDTLLTLGYGHGDSSRTLRTEQIGGMWVRDNQRRIGLVAGAVAGVAVGIAAARSKNEICFKGSPPAAATCHGNIVINALVFGAGGSLVGLLVGRNIPRWAKIFP